MILHVHIVNDLGDHRFHAVNMSDAIARDWLTRRLKYAHVHGCISICGREDNAELLDELAQQLSRTRYLTYDDSKAVRHSALVA